MSGCEKALLKLREQRVRFEQTASGTCKRDRRAVEYLLDRISSRLPLVHCTLRSDRPQNPLTAAIRWS
jgi:hypothetical protein